MNNKKILLAMVGISLSLVVFNSCYNDSKEALYPTSATTVPCTDTANITYSGTIQPIFLANCTQSTCHNAVDLANGYDLSTYAGSQQAIIYGLVDAINHVGVGASDPMPQNANMLDACTIKKIEIWVNAGAPNN